MRNSSFSFQFYSFVFCILYEEKLFLQIMYRN
jgi:hypothetical protein